MDLSRSFKAYDVRGRIPDELNPDAVYRIGRAFAAWLKPRRVAVGRDIRHSSEEFANALTSGLTESGVDGAEHQVSVRGPDEIGWALVDSRL